MGVDEATLTCCVTVCLLFLLCRWDTLPTAGRRPFVPLRRWNTSTTAWRSLSAPRSGCASALGALSCLRRTRRTSAKQQSAPLGLLPRPSAPRMKLMVQDRQRRMCATVIVTTGTETSGPCTVLLRMDHNCAGTPLLKNTLMDLGAVHRQTGYKTAKHIALNVAGRGCKDALIRLLDSVLPCAF